MVNTMGDLFRQLDFNQYHQILLDNNYYEILFPFLLSFALLYTVLGYVKLFKNKNTGEPYKSVIFVISLIVSWFGVGFETSNGYTVGKLLSLIFPNISSLTIGLLCLYIIGSILGKDFLRGLVDKDTSAYMYYAFGAIGLGSVVFYVGIALGIWDYNPFDTQAYWNVILGLAFLILGIVFIIIDYWAVGMIFLFVFATFLYNYKDNVNILDYFIDPVVFIIVIVIILLSWMGTDKENKEKLRKKLQDGDKNMEKYRKLYGGKLPELYESRVFDNIDSAYESNKNKWKKKYGNEPW